MSESALYAITISSHTAASVRCASGDFSETAPDDDSVAGVLAHGAEHVMVTGHQVHEHVDRELTVGPL